MHTLGLHQNDNGIIALEVFLGPLIKNIMNIPKAEDTFYQNCEFVKNYSFKKHPGVV